jgi:hypothetical protein
MEPGGPPARADLTLRNLSDKVEQYSVEVIGLEPDWYAASVTSVGLFPQGSDQVQLNFKVPRGAGFRPALYPYRVVVSAHGSGEETVVDGTLDLRGTAAFRLELQPLQLTSRSRGKYRIRLKNTGTGNLRLALEAQDPSGTLQLGLPGGGPTYQVTVAPGKQTSVPLVAGVRDRRWVGPERRGTFTVTARPLDARGEPETAYGQFTHRPWMESWGSLLTPFRFLARRLGRVGLRPLLYGAGITLVLGVIVFGPLLPLLRSGLQLLTKGAPVVTLPRPSGWSDFPRRLPWPPWPLGGTGPSACALDGRFVGFLETEAAMVGECAEPPATDRTGNFVRQMTTTGELFWQRDSGLVYLFTGDSAYLLVDGRFTLLHGSGAR